MLADSAKSAAARAGSVAVGAAGACAERLSGDASMLIQFKPRWSVGRAGCVSKEHAAFVNVYSTSRMIRIVGTIFAGLLGLAFGSFLNVCLSRWPAGESVVRPRSHCRNCDHVLAWWENVPLVSWLALRGRCRKCGAGIGWRYPVVELAVGVLWAATSWSLFQSLQTPRFPSSYFYETTATAIGETIFYWSLVALAALDAEYFWLPDLITLPGIALGFCFTTLTPALRESCTGRVS